MSRSRKRAQRSRSVSIRRRAAMRAVMLEMGEILANQDWSSDD
jgi:hypothetical protein